MNSLRWPVILGAVGLLAGFVGPLVLAPGANQGPLLGLLITGPGGFLIGLLIGAILRFSGVSDAIDRTALVVVASLFGAITLYLSFPARRHVVNLIEGDVQTCTDPMSLKEEAVTREDEIDALHRYTPKQPWRAEFDRMLREKPGAVILFDVKRARALYVSEARGSPGAPTADPWRQARRSITYFAAGFDCSALVRGDTLTLASSGNSRAWPPYDIGQLLQLGTATRVSAAHAAFAN